MEPPCSLKGRTWAPLCAVSPWGSPQRRQGQRRKGSPPKGEVASPQESWGGSEQCFAVQCWVPTQRPGQAEGTAQWLLMSSKSSAWIHNRMKMPLFIYRIQRPRFMLDKADGRAGGSCFSGVNGSLPPIPVGAGQSSEGRCQCWDTCAAPSMPRIKGLSVQAAPAAQRAQLSRGPGGFQGS